MVISLLNTITLTMTCEHNLSPKYRVELLEMTREIEGKRVCIWVDTDVATCRQREKDGRRRPGVMARMERMMQRPTMDEGWMKFWY